MRVAHRAALVAATLAVGLMPLNSPAQAQEPQVRLVSQSTVKAKAVAATAKTWRFTFASTATLDRNGIEPSLYRGKFFRPAVERVRKCIVKRESTGHYTSVSRSGYRGAYQMSRALGRGVTWMMLKEHRALLGSASADLAMSKLRATPVSKWTRYWQDAAFSTIFNWEKTKSGAKHWRSTYSRC
ncbi:MAG: hypothetical protein Q7K25_05855 [Actinomycetota bacterium]|nr:hypothetical protein [Actinomycetota bacterium]